MIRLDVGPERDGQGELGIRQPDHVPGVMGGLEPGPQPGDGFLVAVGQDVAARLVERPAARRSVRRGRRAAAAEPAP